MLLYSGLTTEANPENSPVTGTPHKSTDSFTSPSSSCGPGKGVRSYASDNYLFSSGTSVSLKSAAL